jgi:hypothetical protein
MIQDDEKHSLGGQREVRAEDPAVDLERIDPGLTIRQATCRIHGVLAP